MKKLKKKAMALIMVLFTIILVASLGAIFLKIVFTNRYQSQLSAESINALNLSKSGIEVGMQYMSQPANWTDTNDLDTSILPLTINCDSTNTPDGFADGTITIQADGSNVEISHTGIKLSSTHTGKYTTIISKYPNSYIRFKIKSTGEILSNGVVIARKTIEYTVMADDPRNYGQFISIPQDADLFGFTQNSDDGRPTDTTLQEQVGIAPGWTTDTKVVRADASNGQFLFVNSIITNPGSISISGLMSATSKNSFKEWDVSANTTTDIANPENVIGGKGYTTSESKGLPEGENYRYFSRILQGLQSSGLTPGNGTTTQILTTNKNAATKGVLIDVGKDAFITRNLKKEEVKNSLFYANNLDKEVRGQITLEQDSSTGTDNIYITDETGNSNDKYLYNDGDKIVVVPPTIHISSSSDGKQIIIKVVKADGTEVSSQTVNMGTDLNTNDGSFDANTFVIYARGGNIVIDGDSNGIFTQNGNLTIIADTNPARINNNGTLNTGANSVYTTSNRIHDYYKVCKSTDGKLYIDNSIASNPNDSLTKMYAASEGNIIIKAKVVKRGGLTLKNQTVNGNTEQVLANDNSTDANNPNTKFQNNNLTLVSKNFVFLGDGTNDTSNYAKDAVHIGASVYAYNHSMQLIDYDFWGRFIDKGQNLDTDGEPTNYTIPTSNQNGSAFFDFMGSYIGHYADCEGYTDDGGTFFGYTKFQRVTYDKQVQNTANPYAPYFVIKNYKGLVRFTVLNVKSY